MSKHTAKSLEKLGLEDLKVAATELVNENTLLATELKELKAMPSFEADLKAAELVIGEQSDVIKSLETKLKALPVSKSIVDEDIKADEFVKIGADKYSLKSILKRVILDGNTYSREEALKNEKVMGQLVKNNYPHLVKK